MLDEINLQFSGLVLGLLTSQMFIEYRICSDLNHIHYVWHQMFCCNCFFFCISFLWSCEIWLQKIKIQIPCWTPCSSRRVGKCTETPLKCRWVRSCCPVMPITVGSWVLDSCWSGWTPQPVYLVGKDQENSHMYSLIGDSLLRCASFQMQIKAANKG